MGRELGRFLAHRRAELGLSRKDVAERSGLSYPYVSQLENGDREPALKALRQLAPVLEVRPEDLAALVAGGEWATTTSSSYVSARPSAAPSAPSTTYQRDRALLSVERRLRDVPALERISLLNELVEQAVRELRAQAGQ